MAKPKEQTFKLLPEWAISQSEKSLIISGGADATYEIEMETSEPSFFATLQSNSAFTRLDLNNYDQRVLEELLTAEIVVPVLKKSPVLKVAMLGDIGKFALQSTENISIVKSGQPHDLAVIVRINSTYADLLAQLDYQSITKPHLLVDLAFHHTVSIGPLVFPGETACIACLQGRIATRWGDTAPPRAPKVAGNNNALVAELVTTELARIAAGDTSLTNKTVAWNVQDRVVKTNQLLKVPLCPVCTQNKIDYTGALALPWGKDESITDTV